jgi:Tfp pilus assembly protein PilF
MRRSLWVAAFALAAFSVAASAQQKEKEPVRPTVPDPNDPNDYYALGVQQIEHAPGDAASAFYWAIRLSPGWADAHYGRWAALHMEDSVRLFLYYQGSRETITSNDVQHIDSLMLRAMELNPFLYRRFERLMRIAAFGAELSTKRPTGPHQVQTERTMEAENASHTYFAGDLKAIGAYSLQKFQLAIQEWAAVLPNSRIKSYPHAERGRVFYLLDTYDSASAEFVAALAAKETEGKKDLVPLYESKPIYEQSLGASAERQKRLDAAREAYTRALQTDPSFAAAYIALGALDMAKADTAGAIRQMEMAAKVAPNDGYAAFLNGRTLLAAAKNAQALDELKRAVALEPYFAEPHVLLAALYDGAGYEHDAMSEYAQFLALCSPRDARYAHVKERLAKMKADSAAVP